MTISIPDIPGYSSSTTLKYLNRINRSLSGVEMTSVICVKRAVSTSLDDRISNSNVVELGYLI